MRSFLLLFCCALSVRAGSLQLTVNEPSGIARIAAPVTSGVPFPIGALHSNMPLQLFDVRGKEIPLQHRTTAVWRDGSVKWALLDFQTDLAAKETKSLSLRWGAKIERMSISNALRWETNGPAASLTTGPLRLRFARTNALIDQIEFDRNNDGNFALGEKVCWQVTTLLALQGSTEFWQTAPSDFSIEESGPLRTVIRVGGLFGSSGTESSAIRYVARIHAFAGSPRLKIQFKAVNLSTNKMLLVNNYGLLFNANIDQQRYGKNLGAEWSSLKPEERYRMHGAIGGNGLAHEFALGQRQTSGRLHQTNESGYQVSAPAIWTNGVRAAGWALWADDRFSMTLGVRDFWQQFPGALRVDNDGLAIDFFRAVNEPFDWDQGLARTHEVWIDVAASKQTPNPRLLTDPETELLAQAPAQWYCDSKVFGDLAPFDFDLFPDYETLTEASGDKFIKSMATGIRNWGDVYYGGPYKGKNSYMNLEYDVPHNFILQFARTGQRKYLDAAKRMAQHQADIDTNHRTGWQWKHSPRHTEIQAEFGHTFTRGLLENYYLTGNRTTFEAAVTLGDYFTKQIRNPREMGNERQIGWGMISLLPVYEATWDTKYLEAVRAAVDRLAAEQEPGGKFKIRWDNRIAFFNGIAATGFIYYERATGDERAAQAALRTIRRTKGFYPEYAGRTLEALAWAYERTREPEYLDLLKLTYETTMEKVISWNVMELGAPTIFTVHTLPFLEKSGLVTKPKDGLNLTAEQFASENGMHVHHVPAGEGELYLQLNSTEPFQLAIIRKGVWKSDAIASLHRPGGTLIKEWKLPREAKIWQREIFSVKPETQGTYRLSLRSATIENVKSGSYVTWDIATSRAIPAVMQVPGFSGLQFVTPYLFTVPARGADKIELELGGEGEGFKKAVVFDPEGSVAGTMEAFVDLGDTNRYAYKLSAPVPSKHREGIWRLSLQDVSLTKLSGLSPYFSTSERSFFRRETN